MQEGLRRLGPDDADLYRELRLEGLRRHPEAFGASFEEETELSRDQWAARLHVAQVFAASRAGRTAGIAGLFGEQMRKKRHKAVLFGVYVRAEARGHGLGRALVQTVIEAARRDYEQLHTAVVTSNLAARNLYHQLGFKPYGVEPQALVVDGRGHDEELLVLDLGRPGG